MLLRLVLLVVGASAASTSALAADSDAVFREDFSDPALSGWQVDAAPGNTVEVADGRLLIRSRLNEYAHVERALGRDMVTVTALLQPSVPSGVTWSAGVFLYWAPGVWCQLSIIDFQDGQYYTVEAVGARPTEHYLDVCDRAQPHWLRIELGQDCVRFYARADGDAEWSVQRVVWRPDAWQGAPQLLVLGKGFGSAQDPAYAARDLDNSYSVAGEPTEQWFDEVTVEPTPPERQKLAKRELSPAGDGVGEALLAAPGDPTYEQVAALYPPLKHVREAVGTKWHPHEIGVTETGAVELPTAAGGVAIGTVTVGDDPTPFGGAQRPAKRLLDGYLPVVVAQWVYDGVEYEQTVLGYAEEFSDRAPLQSYVHLRATSTTGPRRVSVGFRVEPRATGVLPASATLDLPAEGSAQWAVRLECPVEFGAVAEDVCPCEALAATLATRRFWRAEFAKGMQVSVPDPRLMDGHRAWLAYNAINVDRVGELYEPHDGCGFYEEVYGYSAARYAWVLDLWGRHDEAEAVLLTLISHQTPEGLLDWNFGLTDTGALLIAMAVHYETTGDADWLAANASAALKACEWLTTHRAETREAEPRVRGLIKHRSYCDYPPPVYSYLHNCYCAVGMERIARALSAVGIDARAVAQEAAAYRKDILASMRASAVMVNGRRVIPMEPDTQRLLKDSGYESRDYYGLVASTLLECGLPGPGSREARDIAGFLEEAGGIQLGTSEFVGGIDHAYGYGYMEHQLVNGEPGRYLLGLYTALAYGMSCETFSAVECTQLKSGENAMTLPHLYSGTQQLFMLRTMLLREEADRLVLCSATPRDWLQDGQHIRVDNAPTRSGLTSFRLDSEVTTGRMRVTIQCEGRKGSVEVVLHLRHPEGLAISEVTVNGRKWGNHTAETVTLDVGASPLHVVAYYE